MAASRHSCRVQSRIPGDMTALVQEDKPTMENPKTAAEMFPDFKSAPPIPRWKVILGRIIVVTITILAVVLFLLALYTDFVGYSAFESWCYSVHGRVIFSTDECVVYDHRLGYEVVVDPR